VLTISATLSTHMCRRLYGEVCCGTSQARPVSSPLSTCAAPASRCSLCPFLLSGSLSGAFSRLPCTSCHRRLCRREACWDASSVCHRDLDGFYSVDELFENHRVVNVCRAEHHTERDAPSVRNKVALRALLSFIRRIVAGFLAPLLAGMEAESKEARSHSIWSAWPRRSKSTRCSRCHTLASCHSRNRRQYVTPEPQPISWGNISQGMPLFSTKMMPLRAARSSTRGLPPLGLGGSGGSSGSITSHSSSVTNSLAISSTYPHPMVLKGSLNAVSAYSPKCLE
jgi:hypothetical protein